MNELSSTPTEATDGVASDTKLPFEFSGTTREYFGIWIVNIALTILTLGIFHAWAKVRNHRYFYGHTTLADGRFDYHADPVAILKGWGLAMLAYLSYFLLSNIAPWLGLMFFLVILAATPWLVVKSLQFRARNTSFRNLRFGFRKNYAEAAKSFVLYVLILMTRMQVSLWKGYENLSRRILLSMKIYMLIFL